MAWLCYVFQSNLVNLENKMFKETFIVLYYTIKLIVATSQNKKHIEKNVP